MRTRVVPQASQNVTVSTGARVTPPKRPTGYPSGIIATVSTSAGMPRRCFTARSYIKCSVVSVAPRPYARHASRMFCTAGKIDA